MIDYIDNFFKKEDYYNIIMYCVKAPYFYGEKDGNDTPLSGMISDIKKESDIYDIISSNINEKVSCVKNLNLSRMYINCFAPGEKPYFHRDGETGITCLFYVNPENNINDGGETQFIIDGKSYNIFPIPNRLCFFDASITHRATSYRDFHRFTIAIKYA